MSTRFWSLLVGCVVAVFLIGCEPDVDPATGPVLTTEELAAAQDNYQSFEDADALAEFLDYDETAEPMISAHRGGPASGFPENALPTMQRSLQFAPMLLEFDLRLTEDSTIIVLHDETLDRTTTGEGPINEHTFAETRELLLRDDETREVLPIQMPTLDEVLTWARGRAVITIDVKPDVPFDLVVDAVRRTGTEGESIIIVYNQEDLETVHEFAPNLNISASVTSEEELEALEESDVDLSRIIAFTGVGNVQPDLIEQINDLGIRAMLGTFGDIDERAVEEGPEVFHELLDQGVDVIATDEVEVAAEALETYEPVAP